MELEVRTVVEPNFAENTYIVWKRGATDALVIDPGLEPQAILDCLRDNRLTVAALLNTHGHADHIAGNRVLKKAFPRAPLIIGERDAVMLADSFANLSALFGMPLTSPPADRVVKEGDLLELAGLALEVRHIPGHSPGHVVFIVHDVRPVHVFGGDVLFRGGIGRSDFPGGDGNLLLAGIRQKLFDLPNDTVVYPGHGPATTTGVEKATNPYLM
jgi:glyoxylase-like metal-dependent hydrolase (beta-lactamase superfamily II)